MTTQTIPDATLLENLDFHPPCTIKKCSREASWFVVLKCGHDFLVCDPCWSHFTSFESPKWVECLRCNTKWLTMGEAVADAHRL